MIKGEVSFSIRNRSIKTPGRVAYSIKEGQCSLCTEGKRKPRSKRWRFTKQARGRRGSGCIPVYWEHSGDWVRRRGSGEDCFRLFIASAFAFLYCLLYHKVVSHSQEHDCLFFDFLKPSLWSVCNSDSCWDPSSQKPLTYLTLGLMLDCPSHQLDSSPSLWLSFPKHQWSPSLLTCLGIKS